MEIFTLIWGSSEWTLLCTKVLLCISVAVPAAEYLAVRAAFRPQGVLSGRIMSLSDNSFKLLPKQVIDFVFNYSTFLFINVVKIVLCLALLVVPPTVSFYLLLALTFLSLVSLYRNSLGSDGSDQMNLVLCVALTILYSQPYDGTIAKISLIFIASQSLLSYIVAGVAKLISPVWRNGIAVKRIMNTRSYGNATIARFLNKENEVINLGLCWSVIIMETLFPLVLFLPSPFFWIFLIWGFLFHLYNAIAMGLNVFFWAFIATYPSILFFRILIVNS